MDDQALFIKFYSTWKSRGKLIVDEHIIDLLSCSLDDLIAFYCRDIEYDIKVAVKNIKIKDDNL